jgi:hypothetical protein
MAIKAKYNKNGPDFNNAYFKIMSVQGSKENGLTALLNVYYDNAARVANAKPLDQINKSIDWDGTGNPYNLIYAAIKTDFTGDDI